MKKVQIEKIKKYENYILLAEYYRKLGKDSKSCKYANKAAEMNLERSGDIIYSYCDKKIQLEDLYKLFIVFPAVEFWR